MVDEPDQPAGGLGRDHVRRAWPPRLARGRARRAGVGARAGGDRLANAARFLIALFGVSGFGRVLVPVNFRLNADEVALHRRALGRVGAARRPGAREPPDITPSTGSCSARQTRDAVLGGRRRRSPGRHRRGRDRDDQLHVGHHRAPKGVQLTHRNCWLNAVTFGWHLGSRDRDVYLHTLPMFHCNGWGMPYALTGMGARHVVIRKIDGAEILRRIERQGVTLLNGAPAVVAAVARRRPQGAGRRGPRAAARVRIIVAGAPPPTVRSSGSRPCSAGSSSRSTGSPRPRPCSR